MRSSALPFVISTLSLLACMGGSDEASPTDPDGAADVDIDIPDAAEAPDAPDAEPQLETAWMVIAESSGDKTRAKGLFDKYVADGLPSHGVYPRFESSTGIEGLKPDFWLVTVAMSDTKPVAEQIEKHLEGKGWSNSYVREVQVPPEQIERGLRVDDWAPPAPVIVGWVSEGEGCRWVSVDAGTGEETGSLGTLPVKCGRWSIAKGPGARFLVSMNGSFEVDTVSGKVTAIETPKDAYVDSFAYGPKGELVAWFGNGQFKSSDDEEKGWFDIDGERFDIPDYDPYAMEYQLCSAHERQSDGSWKLIGRHAEYLNEGRKAPFCPSRIGDRELSMSWVPYSQGGHGSADRQDYSPVTFPEAELTPEMKKVVEANKEHGTYEWSSVMLGSESILALNSMWLEGHSYSCPVMLEVVQGEDMVWKTLVETDRCSFDFVEQGHYMIGCGGGAAVYDTRTGDPVWTGDACPGWWSEILSHE